ncbi:MAG: DUF2147 domain-containing protein [Bacteroidota bacterium]
MKRIALLSFVLFAGLLFAQTANAQCSPDDIIGEWVTDSAKSKVKIWKSGNKYYGKIVWLKEPIDEETGKPKLNKHHPDKSKQSEPVKGLQILRDLEFDEDCKWEDGYVYDPENGKEYSGYAELLNENKLKLRGYIGISLIGRTTYWRRVKG